MMDEEDTACCPKCTTSLTEPFILCTQCQPNIHLCLHCFARGVEFGDHESNHAYAICKKDFPVFESQWSAQDEERLLSLVQENGYGNWRDVSQQMKNKSSSECEKHYNQWYIENPHQALPKFPESQITYHPSPIVFKLSEDPPRPAEGTALSIDMAGYMAARGDFSIEHDNFVELELQHIEFENDGENQLEEDLKTAVIEIYNTCLKERQRRKKIIRDYGLINYRKLMETSHSYERSIRHIVDSLRVFMRLQSPMQSDMYLESLNHEQELKNDIRKLQEYRENGLTRFRHMKIYSMLKSRRTVTQNKRHLLKDILSHIQDESACQSWLNRQVALDNVSKGIPLALPAAPRKSAPPLDISGLPGQEKLSQKERELCASVRLVPEAFSGFKRVLMSECQRAGCLKLAQARTLIKIDVNKTRKLYDYLIQEGFINKDPI
ncbi:transcriptional adapter 2-alpha-like [Haliotis cracherodii]|uniref:transcriptional adapter 2-alpha-like n=1 Tax=Haliotis cracherodii TaxID=6455 RepID=UPI0039EA144C